MAIRLGRIEVPHRIHTTGGVPTVADMHTTILPGDRIFDDDTGLIYTINGAGALVEGDPSGSIDASGS